MLGQADELSTGPPADLEAEVVLVCLLLKLFGQYREEVRLVILELECDITLGLPVGLANLFLVEYAGVEPLSEVDGSLV